jgi:hypothetical protein
VNSLKKANDLRSTFVKMERSFRISLRESSDFSSRLVKVGEVCRAKEK